jgi:hypothetical protein
MPVAYTRKPQIKIDDYRNMVYWFSGIFRDAPPNVGRIANPTYAAPPDMLVYHGNSQ